jgi:FkbM family methyltransferase
MNRTAEILAWIGNRIGKPPGWERVVRVLAPPNRCGALGEICVMRDGTLFLARPTVPLSWYVAFFGTYEPELREILRALLPPGGTAVDVGANVGWHTLLMARLVGDRGRVLAVEANPSVRMQLEENIRLNRCSQVQVFPFAVSNSNASVEFFGPSAEEPSSGDGHVVTNAEPGASATIRVEARRFDVLINAAALERLDLIKIDVEGHEWPVLQGAEDSVARFRPNIVFEYNDEYIARGGGSQEAFEKFFARHRYKLYAIGRNWATAVTSRNWPKNADVLAIPAP